MDDRFIYTVKLRLLKSGDLRQSPRNETLISAIEKFKVEAPSSRVNRRELISYEIGQNTLSVTFSSSKELATPSRALTEIYSTLVAAPAFQELKVGSSTKIFKAYYSACEQVRDEDLLALTAKLLYGNTLEHERKTEIKNKIFQLLKEGLYT